MVKRFQHSSFRYLATWLVAIFIITLLEAVPLSVRAASMPCSVTFDSQVTYSVGLSPYVTAIGDFNADGKSDLATANSGSTDVSILLGNGNGTFQAATNYAAGNGPRWLTIDDYNGDSKLDLAVANSGDGNVSVLLGNGDGTFQSRVNFTAGNFPIDIVKGDFNADDKLDLATANYFGLNVSILLGNGDGTFQAPVNYAITGPYALTVGDFNADGKLDLATANDQANTVSVLLGNGDGTFQTPVDYAVGNLPGGVTTGDLNADGKLDLVAANPDSNTVSVLLGDGNGAFQAQVTYSAESRPYKVSLGDFNGDGKLDLATPNLNSNTVGVLLGNGNGTFQAQVTFAAGSSTAMIAVNDFNEDGKLDLVATNYASANVSILLNTGSCEIDVQGNSVSIASGDTTPSTSDHTDFGSVNANSGTVAHTFTVQNSGDGALTGVAATVSGDAAFSLSSTPATTVSASENTTFTVTFAPTEAGMVTATVSIANNDSDENPYTFVLGGTGLNSAPTASNGSAITAEDTAKTITLPANDANGDSLNYTVVAPPANGSVTVVGNSATYTPTHDFNGSDSFTFQATDGQVASNVATVAVTVEPVNDRPIVVSERITMPEDSLNVTIPVLANDSDVDGDSLSLLRAGTPSQGGTVSIQGSSLLYNPAANFSGTETFTYTVRDGHNGSANGRVTAVVTAVNDAPETVVTATVSEGSASFAFSATDVDSTVFTYQCALDGAAFAACTSPQSYSNLGMGAHSFQARARDNKALVDPTPASHTWSVAPATLTIVLDAQPDSGVNRTFSSPSLPRFYLNDSVSDTDAYTRTQSFTVAPGTYTITEAAATVWHLRDILCSPGANATVNNATRTLTITVVGGDNVTCTFTEQQGGIVVARSFVDLNGNGVKGASEPYTKGVTLRLYSAPGVIAATRTTANFVRAATPYIGYTRFRNVPPGTYALCMVPPAGWVPTRPATIMAAYDNLPCFAPITVAPNQGASYLVGNKLATVGAATSSAVDDATADEAELAQLLAEELQALTQEAETPTSADLSPSEVAFGPHPLFLPLIRTAGSPVDTAGAATEEAFLAPESVAEAPAIVMVSEPTDASVVGDEGFSAAPAAEDAAVAAEANRLHLFLPVIRR